MYTIGLSTCSKTINEELFKLYANAGIKAMEISADYEVLDSLDANYVKKLANEYGVNLWSYHLPFWTFDLFDITATDCEQRKQNVKRYEKYINEAAQMGITKFVLHPSGEPIEDNERKERLEYSKESIFTLSQIAKQNGGVLAVEDLPRSCLGNKSSEILELIAVDSSISVCFDTNHLLNEDIVQFIKNVGSRIITTHVSDYDFINERHWLPGEGKIDWQSVLKALKDVGYNGPWLYEIGFKSPKTIIRERDLTCADFVKNANELFEGKNPTVFGKPKENLGFWPE